MHRSYQPLKPVTNRYLQQRWDRKEYEEHRRKVSSALPAVDTKGLKTPAHVQLKLKKLQLQEERLSVIERDNHLLASKLTHIFSSRGRVDHQNHYQLRSLNADRRREELLLLARQNQSLHQRITARQSDYRRPLWLNDWQRTENHRNQITRFPRGAGGGGGGAGGETARKVTFAASEETDASRDSRKPRAHLFPSRQ